MDRMRSIFCLRVVDNGRRISEKKRSSTGKQWLKDRENTGC